MGRTNAVSLIAVGVTLFAQPPTAAQTPAGSRVLELAAPIETWDEGLPLGNGMTGGLLWGSGNEVRLSLDRGDLWDERRPAITEGADWTWDTIRRLVAEGNQAEISRLFDAPYHAPYPTKLPGGRLVITLPESQEVEGFALDLDEAVGRVALTDGALECFFSAELPVALLRLPCAPLDVKILRPGGLDALDYPAAEFGEQGEAASSDVGKFTWMVQKAALDLEYAVVVCERRTDDGTLIAVAITSSTTDQDPGTMGRRRTGQVVEAGWDYMVAPHRAWWREFWATSSVRIPDEALQRHYDLVSYFYGAASRVGAPPMPLQGVWTRDDGGLPPWKGDFHHDLNTQMTYLPYHTAGYVEAGRSFLDLQWDLLPTYRRFAREFHGVEGAAMPAVATLAGQATGGWSQYSLHPTNALWVGHSFYLHWRYTMDRVFLEERAYPWLSAMATGIVQLLEERDGRLYLPLSSSPEIHDNSFRAWLTPNSNYDQDLMRWAFGALAEMAGALGREGEALRWQQLMAQLPPPHVDADDVLMFAAGEPFHTSHRHHSQTMALHPLGTLHIEGDERSRRIIHASLDRMMQLGTQAWVGYSFSWFACLLARAGRADEALHYLRDYERAFTLRNGFHVNGDQLGEGLSGFRYRPFTLEGNFLAMEAVHEMLLQSWGDRVRVFPAVPEEWQEVSFDRLRAQGAFVVSAERSRGRTRQVSVTATVPGLLRLVDPFAGAAYRSDRDFERVDDELRCHLGAGETVVLTLADPAPAGEGRPVVSLAGEWRVRLDPDDRGEAEAWHRREISGDAIRLPGTTDQAGLGYALDVETMTYPVAFLDSEWPGSPAAERRDEAGHLVRRHMYLGKVWYQRTIHAPEDWAGRNVELFLERITWRSKVWVDGRSVGECDSLVAPHRHDLGTLAPGPHRLTVLVDNGPVHAIGILGHAYGPETQSRWNGIVGRMELIARPLVRLEDVQVHPAPDRRSVLVATTLDNDTDRARTGRLRLAVLDEQSGTGLGATEIDLEVERGRSMQEFTVTLDGPAPRWSEFDPRRCVLASALTVDGQLDRSRTPFGFRHIERDGRRIRVNGTPIFLRGTLDCAVYPRAGHPPMTVEEWLETFGVIRNHGFNHVRFHTWCPPEAAFEAADRLGLYLAPETAFWVDNWTTDLGPKPGLFGADPRITSFVRDEILRISRAYGNHPSFALFCIGNEFGMSSDWDLVNQVLGEAKADDARHLYNATTARKRVAADDFWVTHRTDRPVRGLGPSHTNWDFTAGVEAVDLPVLAHETGQRPVFPDYQDLLPRFDGPLVPYNYTRLRDALDASGMADQGPDFERASALFQDVQYKAEHEAFHRTAGLAGYQLLMLNDFTGQSEALVGILDPFWRSKGIVSAADVRRWNATTVALARFDRFVWASDEEFAATLEVSHFGPSDFEAVSTAWTLSADDGSFHVEGSLPATPVLRGTLTQLGPVQVPLSDITRATALRFRVQVAGVTNEWKVWVYPPAATAPKHDVYVTSRFDDKTKAALADGRSVLLLGHGVEHDHAKRTGFASVYWSAGWWGDAFSSLGILCDPAHPALAAFPNNGHSDWQWQELTEGATTYLLDGAPAGYRPIVQPVTDFHHLRLLGQVFEARVGPGRLVVCGYDLESDLPSRHAARQFRRSLLAYMHSDAFQPSHELAAGLLERWL